jgi:hypothetical protein
MVQDNKGTCSWGYAIVALAAFLIGMALGQLGAVREAGPSRIPWPAPTVAHPRSLQP